MEGGNEKREMRKEFLNSRLPILFSYFHHTINLQNLEASEEAKTAWLSHSLSTTINCGVVLKNNCCVVLKLIVALLLMHSKYHIHFQINVYKD